MSTLRTRRRSRLTRPKKSAPKQNLTEGQPTSAEWERMKPYGQLKLTDEDNSEHVFKIGDNILIHPWHAELGEEIPRHEYWVGRIQDIRAAEAPWTYKEQDPGFGPPVWARIQWYYSGEDAARAVKSFDRSTCGQFERLFSDTYDYVSSQAFEAVVTVKDYNERDLLHDDIEEDEFYRRFYLEYKRRRIIPNPTIHAACICKRPYAPDDPNAIMHFCPRPDCCRAFHQECLLRHGSVVDSDHTTDPGLFRLQAAPADTLPIEILVSKFPASEESQPARKKRGRPKKQKLAPGVSVCPSPANLSCQLTPEAAVALESLPPKLVAVAKQPIVKGAGLGPGYLVGNVRSVVAARRMVYSSIQGLPIPDEWDEVIVFDDFLAQREFPLFLCPLCQSAI